MAALYKINIKNWLHNWDWASPAFINQYMRLESENSAHRLRETG
jgi:hypothetical protein